MLAIRHRKFDLLRQQARQDRKKRFGALIHHLDVDLLKCAHGWLRQEAPATVEPRAWEQYEQKLQANLVNLHGRIQRGVYRAPHRRRRWLPFVRTPRRWRRRAVLEDRLVQRATQEVVSAIYEEDFLNFSYGFRFGRSQRDALMALAMGASSAQLRWIVYVDMARFFESASHRWLVRCVEYRIGDSRLIRLICRWLKAGVMDGGAFKTIAPDSPKGTIAPLLANIYLHYVFDLWAARWRHHHGRGAVLLVRYGGDIIAGFEREVEARRFTEQLRERLAGFAPSLPMAKTRLVEFDRKAWEQQTRNLGDPRTWRELADVPTFRKGLALLQRQTPFQIHSPQNSVASILLRLMPRLLPRFTDRPSGTSKFAPARRSPEPQTSLERS